MHLSCNFHDNYISVVHVQGFYRVYRGSTEHYWDGMSSHVGFYMILVYDVGIMMWPGQISLDLFRDLQVAWSKSRSVWLLSIGHVPRGGMILLSTWSCYFIDRNLRDRVNLVGRGFEPRTKQYDIFIGPGFNSQPRSPISGQCDPWPKSLAPTNGELGWCEKKTSWEEKHARGRWTDYCKRKT